MGTFYSQEFKDQLIQQHREGHSFVELAKEFGVSASAISNWVRADERRQGSKARAQVAVGEPDSVRIARLERELARKDEELEILGKALAFFARRAEQ